MDRSIRLLCALGLAATLAACGRDAPPSARDIAAEHKALALLGEERFQQPPGWQWGRLVNADGAHLRYGHAEPQSRVRGVIVFATAYASPAEEYFETVRDFLRAGYAVWILDRRGQGGSDRWPDLGQRAYLTSLGAEARDLQQFSALAKTSAHDVPLFLTGESLGGLVGLAALKADRSFFRAAAFSSPAIDFQTGNLPKGGVRVLTSFMSAIGFGGSYVLGQHDWRFNAGAGEPGDPIVDDRDRALAPEGWLLTHPELREGGFTNRFVHTLFLAADTEEAKGWAARITTPVLIGMVPGDAIASPAAMQAACSEMHACTLLRFPGAAHALYGDRDATRSRWINAVIAFFDERGKAGS
jgi:lysophospholipase